MMLYIFSDGGFNGVRSSIPVTKDQDVVSLEEKKVFQTPNDNPFAFDIDSNENSNGSIQNSALSSDDEKAILGEDVQDLADPMHQNTIDKLKQNISRQVGCGNGSAIEKFILDSDMLTSCAIVSTNAQDFEQERYTKSPTHSVKAERQLNCTDALVKPENESEVQDVVAVDGTSVKNENDCISTENDNIAKNDSVTKVKRPTRKYATKIYCKDCEHTYMSRVTYEKHLKEDKCKHTCEFCGKVFLYKRTCDYKLHMKHHRKQKDHECQICGKLFLVKYKMLQHFKLHANPKPKMCEKCGKGFPSTISLTLHLKRMHAENRDLVQCSKCAKMYKSKSSLRYHMRAVHESDDNASFSCSICDKSFKVERNLTYHKQTHKKTKDFKCNKCDASFKYSSSLASHQRRHDKAYTMFCKTCNKGFYEKRNLKEHENMHSGLKPYQCFICDFRCAFKHNLPKHMKIHKGTS